MSEKVVIKLPCNVGDRVWKIVKDKHIFGFIVRSFIILKDKILVELANKSRENEGYVDIRELGKTWFLYDQKEEAQKQLSNNE